jgi:hypothetical protein
MDHHGSVPVSQCPIVSTQAIVGLPLTRSTSGSLVAPPRVVSTPPQLEEEEEAGLRLSETPTVCEHMAMSQKPWYPNGTLNSRFMDVYSLRYGNNM